MKRIFSILFALVLILSFSLIPATPAMAATLEVGPGKTYATIQGAVNAAAPYDTILVYPSTYTENVDVTTNDLTITSTGGASVTIVDGSGATPPR